MGGTINLSSETNIVSESDPDLDERGRYRECVYDRLVRRVREAMDEEIEERSAIMEEAGLSARAAERAAWMWSAWGRLPAPEQPEVPM